MRTTVWVYEAVKLPITKPFVCVVCGKPGRRTKTFRQTINPFNRNADGQAKYHAEIMAELQSAAQQWHPDMHAKCER